MANSQILNIGFDDTDSPKGMCTTFLAYKIVDSLKKQDIEFLDFPKLIRFNPNIPWKTRGNGAVSMKIRTKNSSKIKNHIKKLVEKYSDIKNGANPGLVFYENKEIPDQFSKFSKLALWQLINRNHAKKFARKNNMEFFYQGNGQGLVGAIGAIGYDFKDHTLELLSYRKNSKFGKKRNLSAKSVKIMQEKTLPFTFNSFDNKKERVLITPHGPDPVFYGVRGENIDSLLRATKILKTSEKLSGYMIFKSNQGTGDHLKNELNPKNIKPYASGKITGIISDEPTIVKGGHVFFSINSDGFELCCAVYKPTGITSVASSLIKGDKVCVGGGIRKASKNHPRILNLEFIDIIELKKNMIKSNPNCKKCNKKMKSKGNNQGFQCIKCGKKSENKVSREIPRKIKKQLYVPIVSAHRHLSRPVQRIGRINKESKFDESSSWFCVYDN
ncbi:tRNA(Ile)(2)-agmatinylcytidine synthase [Nitrosarchaeum koreense]|uniref:tRNA(Ile2) 2-agmatinylcytidine synthetase TiaS n=1 Tax=Nitrosarchaeum koreense MY1 TaxID=1001994 RepID=F9CYN5_9ARCH|nr:tRNA(Ile)(2)-agmatinylcytidine synthase [Nitrosarchaeum koreense]EGP94429.1 DNA-binding protein containing a Zn-ribbon domain-containing protein [Nitrosarchaeum koreense MY1]